MPYDLKGGLLELIDSLDYIPIEFRRRDLFPLDINRNKLFINQKRNIIVFVKHGKWKEYTPKTFFLNPKLSDELTEQVERNIDEWLLFKKLANKELKASDIIHCKNAEIRRVLLERYGYEKFLLEMKGVVVHEDGDYKLLKLDWHEKEEPIKLLKMKDSTTSRWYILRVPPNVKTCREAVAWGFGLKAEEYNPLKET